MALDPAWLDDAALPPITAVRAGRPRTAGRLHGRQGEAHRAGAVARGATARGGRVSVYNDLTHAREAIRVLIGVLPVSAFNALTEQIVDRPEIILAIAE